LLSYRSGSTVLSSRSEKSGAGTLKQAALNTTNAIINSSRHHMNASIVAEDHHTATENDSLPTGCIEKRRKRNVTPIHPALFSTSLMPLSPDDFHFRIDLWDDAEKRIEQVIAFVSDFRSRSRCL
jgi:hypothetical protein